MLARRLGSFTLRGLQDAGRVTPTEGLLAGLPLPLKGTYKAFRFALIDTPTRIHGRVALA